MISMRWFVRLVGAVLLVAGLALGFTGVNVGSVSCGSPFEPDSDAAYAKDLIREQVAWNLGVKPEAPSTLVADCDQAIGSRPTFAWVLLGGGAIALLGGLLVRTGQRAG